MGSKFGWTSRNNIAEDCSASDIVVRALAGKERALGADHPSTLATVKILVIVLKKAGDADAAAALRERLKAAE